LTVKQVNDSQRLIKIGSSHTLFHSATNVAYAEIPVDQHVEVWPIESSEYKALLIRQFYQKTRRAVSDKLLKEVTTLLATRARYDGAQREASIRVSGQGSNVFIDRTNSEWNTVGIGLTGWKLFDRPFFTRKRGMLELPEPKVGGSLADLRQFVNLTDEQWTLYQAFLVSSLRPDGPYWMLVLNGQQGSGKSVLSAVTRSLIDPSQVVSQGSFKNENDLVIAAQNSHLLVFDNLSKITDPQSDALCRLVTGSGLRARELYTDSNENLMQVVNPVVLNGITNFVTRPDLEDRSLQLWLKPLPSRKPEQTFWEEFEEAKPSILGGLYSAVSKAISRLDSVEVTDDIRMIDSFRWALAAEPALDCGPGDLLKAYRANKARRTDEMLSSSPLIDLIRMLAEQKCKKDGNWVVSPKQLQSALMNRTSDLDIPEPAQLSNQLIRNITVLAAAGVNVCKLDRTAKGARYEFSVGNAG
jgi:putative DNA primase/helicase